MHYKGKQRSRIGVVKVKEGGHRTGGLIWGGDGDDDAFGFGTQFILNEGGSCQRYMS